MTFAIKGNIIWRMETLSASKISQKVLSLMKEQGVRFKKPFAEKIGIDKSNFYGMLEGKRGWTLENLEKVAAGLGVGVSDLLAETPTVPLVAEIIKGGFQYTKIRKEQIGKTVFITEPGEKALLEKTYALKIGSNDFYPHFRQGWTIFLQEGVDPSEFKSGDRVIFCRENGQGLLREVSFSEDRRQVVLRSLALGCDDLTLSPDHLNLCHKVIATRYT